MKNSLIKRIYHSYYSVTTDMNSLSIEYFSYFFAFVFPYWDTTHDLLIDQICSYRVIFRIIPRNEIFLPEIQPPSGTTFTHAHLLRVLFTFSYCVHNSMHTISETRNLYTNESLDGASHIVICTIMFKMNSPTKSSLEYPSII